MLGLSGFIALYLTLLFAFASGVGAHGPALWAASILLVLCAAFGLITTVVLAVTSVVADRVLYNTLDPKSERGQTSITAPALSRPSRG